MAANPGLKSRFSEKLHFRDFTALEACQLLRAQLRKDSLQLAAGAEQQLPDLMQQVRGLGGSAHGPGLAFGACRKLAWCRAGCSGQAGCLLRARPCQLYWLPCGAAGGGAWLVQRARRGHLGQARLLRLRPQAAGGGGPGR